MSIGIEVKVPDCEERSRYSSMDREYLILKAPEYGDRDQVEVQIEHLKIKVYVADLVRAVEAFEKL